MRNRNDFGRAMDKRAGRTATVRNGVVASRVSSSRYTVTLSDTGETVTAMKEVSGDEFVVGQPVRVVGVSAAKTSTGTGWSIMGSGTEIASGGAVGTWTPYSGGHTHIIADVTGLQDALDAKADKTTQIIAGTGLTGGGTLAADRTLTLANTAVTPGTYTHSTITVDAQGRITSASSGSVGVGSGRLISTTLPLRIDGGASADLSADRTLSINDFTGDAGAGGLKGAVPAPAAGDAAANKFLSAGGGWATAITDISGLVDLTNPQTITGIKSFTKTYGTDADLPNLLSYDLRAMAAGVGGGIAFGGKYKAAGDTVTFALVRGYKKNATEADYGGGFQVWTLESGGGAKVKHLDISSTGLTQVLADGDVVSGNFKSQLLTQPTDASGKGVRLGYDSSLGYGVIAPAGQSARLDFWTYQSAAWARTAHVSSGLFVGEGLAAGFKHLAQASGTNGIYAQIQDLRDYIDISASSDTARSGAPGFRFRESHDDAATWTDLVLIGVNGDVVLHASGVEDATGATTGAVYIPCVNGTPTGVPARSVTGAAPFKFDRAANKLMAYNGGWVEIGGGGSYQPLDAALTALAGGSDFVKFTGPTTSIKTFTLPDTNGTILTQAIGDTLYQDKSDALRWLATGTGKVAFANTAVITATYTVPDFDAFLLYAGGALGTPSSGTLTNCGGTAASLIAGKATILETARAIYGNNFDGSAALAQIIASTYGGTGNGFTKFTGPTTTEKTFTLPNANATLLYDTGSYTQLNHASGAYLGADYTYGGIWHSGITVYGDVSTSNTFCVFDTEAMAASVGGGFTLGGKYKGDGSYTDFGAIFGRKLNATEADTNSLLQFQYTVNGIWDNQWEMGQASFRPLTDDTMNVGDAATRIKTLYTNGVSTATVAKTATYTATASDFTIRVTPAAATTISLPAAASVAGRIYVIRKMDSSANAVTIDPAGSEQINGATTYTVPNVTAVMIQSNGTSWDILSVS